MAKDFISQWLSIKNFDPTVVISPDSVRYKKQSVHHFAKNFFTAVVLFRTLDGRIFRVKGKGTSLDTDVIYVTINNDKFQISRPNDYDLITVDAFIQTPFGNAKYTSEYSNGSNIIENLDLDSENIPISIGEDGNNYNIYDILLSNQEYFNTLQQLNIISENDVKKEKILPPNSLLNWKLRYRVDKENYYVAVFEKGKFFEDFVDVKVFDVIGNHFESNFLEIANNISFSEFEDFPEAENVPLSTIDINPFEDNSDEKIDEATVKKTNKKTVRVTRAKAKKRPSFFGDDIPELFRTAEDPPNSSIEGASVKIFSDRSIGSGTVIHKQKISDDLYCYTGVTAAHVVRCLSCSYVAKYEDVQDAVSDSLGEDFELFLDLPEATRRDVYGYLSENNKLKKINTTTFEFGKLCESSLILDSEDTSIFYFKAPKDYIDVTTVQGNASFSEEQEVTIFGYPARDLSPKKITATVNANPELAPCDFVPAVFYTSKRPLYKDFSGMSGGGVFNSKNELIGIISSVKLPSKIAAQDAPLSLGWEVKINFKPIGFEIVKNQCEDCDIEFPYEGERLNELEEDECEHCQKNDCLFLTQSYEENINVKNILIVETSKTYNVSMIEGVFYSHDIECVDEACARFAPDIYAKITYFIVNKGKEEIDFDNLKSLSSQGRRTKTNFENVNIFVEYEDTWTFTKVNSKIVTDIVDCSGGEYFIKNQVSDAGFKIVEYLCIEREPKTPTCSSSSSESSESSSSSESSESSESSSSSESSEVVATCVNPFQLSFPGVEWCFSESAKFVIDEHPDVDFTPTGSAGEQEDQQKWMDLVAILRADTSNRTMAIFESSGQARGITPTYTHPDYPSATIRGQITIATNGEWNYSYQTSGVPGAGGSAPGTAIEVSSDSCKSEHTWDDDFGGGPYPNINIEIIDNPCCKDCGGTCQEGMDTDCDGACDDAGECDDASLPAELEADTSDLSLDGSYGCGSLQTSPITLTKSGGEICEYTGDLTTFGTIIFTYHEASCQWRASSFCEPDNTTTWLGPIGFGNGPAGDYVNQNDGWISGDIEVMEVAP